MNIDQSYEALEKFETEVFIKFKNESLSETDTRSKILDSLLINVLGWEEIDVEREGWVREGFFDYEIRTPSFKFLIEAKKNHATLDLPSKGSVAKLKTLYKSNKEVIDQIRNYLFQRGLQYGVISNGKQFIIARFVNHDGEDWQNNTAIFFNGFDAIKRNFNKFYEILSREFVSYHGRLKIDTKKVTANSAIANLNLPHLHEELVRNKLSSELIPVLSQVFEEIYKTSELTDREILKKCYVSNEDVLKYSDELNSIFIDNPPNFDHRIAGLRNTKNTQESIKKDLNTGLSAPDPIIVIGTAGAGKTTFIKNFTENFLTPKEKKKRPIVYIDFREFTSQEVHDTANIYSQIIQEIKNEHPDLNVHKRNILKTIFKTEIKENKEGIWENLLTNKDVLEQKISSFLEEQTNNPITYLERISNYLIKQCDKRLCVVFDNADQLKDSDQRKIFLLAHSINRKLGAIVITSIREGYYFRWKDKPPFNAYHSTVYHITAPPYSKVLKKRIEYALETFDFKDIKIQVDQKKVAFQKGSLKILFRNLYRTLFQNDNSKILRFLEETSYPNIRHGLEMFQTFLLSGHSKTTEYMSLAYKKGIPYWEFVKSVALESSYYYSDRSKIVNLFLPVETNQNHFTKIRILNFLLIENQREGKGLTYVNAKELIDIFVKIGYSKDVVFDELNQLLDYNLIITSDYLGDIEDDIALNENSKIAISSVGHYYIKELIHTFPYLDLTVQNTPIYSEKHFTDISKSFPKSDKYGHRDLVKRLETSKVFLDYLISQEVHDLKRPKLTNENLSLSQNITAEIRDLFEKEYKSINKKIAHFS